MKMGRPNLDEFGATLLELGQQYPNLLVVTSDSRGSGKLTPFGKALPHQIVEVGIAEQNLVGVAAGLAASGKHVFAVSPACFLTTRALEQIKNDVAYSDHPVKLIGISAGVSYGALGSTHHSLHDFATLRTFHNLDIVAPADNFETRAALRASLSHPRPLYIRMGKRAMPDLHPPHTPFQIGKAIWVDTEVNSETNSEANQESGKGINRDPITDVTFVATGETVAPAVLAARQLAAVGIHARVLSVHTIKPLDQAAILAAAHLSQALITVEEHSVLGGLGGACAELLMSSGTILPFQIVGIPDEYTVTGSQAEIFEHYGITPDGLATTAKQLLHRVPVLS
jgi:transketolase